MYKRGVFVVEEAIGSFLELSAFAKEAPKVLKGATRPVGPMHYFPFQELLEAVKQFCKDINEKTKSPISKVP